MIALAALAVTLIAAAVRWRRQRESPVVGVLLAVVAVLPIGTVALGSGLAAMWGCTANESGTTPCPVGGWDAGPLLTDLFVSGWWMLVTLPLGGGLFLAWLLTRPRTR